MTHEFVFAVILWLCEGYALVRGGAPERAGAALMLLSVYISGLVLSPAVSPTSRFSHLEVGLFLVDLIAYAASLVLMLRAERFWTIWLSALFGVELLAHVLAIPNSPSLNLTYAILEQVWGYPLALLPAIGAWRHQQRLKTYGTDRSWSVSSNMSRQSALAISPDG